MYVRYERMSYAKTHSNVPSKKNVHETYWDTEKLVMMSSRVRAENQSRQGEYKTRMVFFPTRDK